jgi:hypothetical protein
MARRRAAPVGDEQLIAEWLSLHPEMVLETLYRADEGFIVVVRDLSADRAFVGVGGSGKTLVAATLEAISEAAKER